MKSLSVPLINQWQMYPSPLKLFFCCSHLLVVHSLLFFCVVIAVEGEVQQAVSWFLKASEIWREWKMPMGMGETDTGPPQPHTIITLQPSSPWPLFTLPRFCSPWKTVELGDWPWQPHTRQSSWWKNTLGDYEQSSFHSFKNRVASNFKSSC